ncbi:putative sulfatase [Natrinema pellirubrum DSM 15624]|uniref:Arylsulfatase A family protein n=1 Tax=Natrinema pellirubrum (strain DSM 15624 / CIP 106293 / JCM 10476 / NCIMB 786 / 157) TaxID=797303 RepID=L0JHB3_NATP1|nr:sulfatase [Natrinema pellirubrum]AGB30910.1 arylsulfatase A family protein [Natrinema pellirubrum DSM 15624]ELY80704.1 putative sulfatase [Natrinema pellirubrum DSM 15624]
MEPPNIVCVSIDSLRADFCSFLDDSKPTTPFLESLTDESTVYENAITPSTWTLPVHTSVFSGLYPPEHGILAEGNVLGDHPTFPELLTKNGYSTTAFFRNGWLNTAGILRGFERLENGENGDDTDTSDPLKVRIAESVEKYSSNSKELLRYLDDQWKYVKQHHFRWKLYREWSRNSSDIEFCSGGAKTISEATEALQDISAPFCWFLHLNEAHWTYTPPAPYHQMFTDQGDWALSKNGAIWQWKIYGNRINRIKSILGQTDVPESEVEMFRNLYRGGIRYCDDLLKQLVKALQEEGKWENTVLIVFGDHGDNFREDGTFGHHFSVANSLIRVPLLIRDPTGNLPTGRIKQPVSLIDLYATILSLSDTQFPETNSINLLKEERQFAYTYYNSEPIDHLWEAVDTLDISKSDLPPKKQFVLYASSDEKLIWYPEQEKFAGDSSDIKRYRDIITSHHGDLKRKKTGNEELSDSTMEHLEQMGYMK